METNDVRMYKSGTDIRGVASEGVKGEPVTLTDDVIERITAGFASFLAEHAGKDFEGLAVSVGHDSRISAQRIKKAVISTLLRFGVSVFDCGLSSTPAMFMTTVDAGCDGAVQITASHHPWNRNGLKFFTKDGGIDSADLDEILTYAKTVQIPYGKGKTESIDYMKTYAKRLRELICRGVNGGDCERPLEGFKIAVDAGNGAGGFYAAEVLKPLGADITGSQFLEPDGMFPNHIPNPEDKAAMESIAEAVKRNHSDLGIIFDTDVDRAACVDQNGREINRNRLVALASAIALEEYPGGTIVTDSITSSGLAAFIEQNLGGRHRRFKRGYRNVINEAVRLNAEGVCSPLAIETSGHAAFKNNYFLDDGAYLITLIIIKAARLRAENRTLEDLIAELREPAEADELRFKIGAEDFRDYGRQVIEHLEKYAKNQGWQIAPDNYEGIRVSFPESGKSGWFLLRLSVHDPIMPLNIESDVYGGNKKIAALLYGGIKDFNLLDISSLKDYILGSM